MEVSKAEIDAVLDAQGRFVWTPNAVTLDGQLNVPCDLQEGESLLEFLRRHVSGIESGAWSVSIGGAVVPRAMWAHTYPKHGMHIACRAVVGKQVVQLVAMAALSYFTMGAGGAALFGTSLAGQALAIGVYVAGSILINQVLGPKVPKTGDAAAAKQIYSLNSQRNTARPYEPIGVLWGEMRVTPDLAANPYTLFAGDDQYLCTQLLGGINVHSVHDLGVGDTPLSDYSDVQTYLNGFPGHENQMPPMYSNADSIAGAELVTKEGSAGWVTRTTSTGTKRVEIDIEGSLFYMNKEGRLRDNAVTLDIAIKEEGEAVWTTVHTERIVSRSQDTIRRTYGFDLPEGQHEVRVRSSAASQNHDTRATVSLSWVTLRSIQADDTDYSQWGRVAIKIKATGQLSGALDTVRATYRAKPMPIWNGTDWVTATTRENGLSNPGAIILQTLRGVWHNGVLQFGYGMSDDQIDIERLKSFMLHCTAKGYTYDRWITSSVTLKEFCDEVALAGMGEFSWTDGSRPTVVFVSNGQPVSAVVNMANMLKASFSVDYALSNAADGIEYRYVDRDKGFETVTLRVAAPGVVSPLNPARVTGEGVTTEAHAAMMARYHLAQSLYQYKTIGYAADIEHLDYRRLSVLSVSHDLTQWGFGGRLVDIYQSEGRFFVQLDEAVPALTTPHVGLRLPGDRDYRVWPVVAFEGERDTLELVGEWPDDVPVPGDSEANPVHDTLWCYDFKATPGYRVRVTSMEPENDLKGAKITCVPEGPEFWNYVLNGVYEPAPNQSALPQLARPQIKNLKVREQVHVQGDTEWYELHATWDTDGDYDHAQVWAGVDGSEQQLVDANAVVLRSSFRIDGAGEWLVTVRPFDKSGRPGVAASVLFITQGVETAPRAPDLFAVHMVAGGLRRFIWGYTGDRPISLAGVQIRYRAGGDPISVDDWDSLVPLGSADDVYKAQFETTRPPAGLWTFACRAINTSGLLSEGVVTHSVNLDASFEEVQQVDLTPPPAPFDVEVNSALASITVQWAMPDYTEGHGHQATRVYAAQVIAGEPIPVRSAAVMVSEATGPVTSFAAGLGTSWRLWLVNLSKDGVESADAGPFDVTVGMVGDADLSDDLDLASKLADGSISGSKLAAESIDATKFANGVEPVTIVDAPALPTEKATSNIVWGGNLYTWNGTEYVKPEVGDLTFEDIGGQLPGNKLAVGAVDATKIAQGVELVTIHTGATLPTTNHGAVLSWNGKLYRWSGSEYTATVPASDLSGVVGKDQIAQGAIDAGKIAAGVELVKIHTGAALPTANVGSVLSWNGKVYRWSGTAYTAEVAAADLNGQLVAGQLADNAVTAAKIAAGAVNLTKFASGLEPVAVVSGSTLPTTKSTSTIVFGGKLYRWNGTAYSAAVDTSDITGQITATQVSDGAISTPKLAANAVTADKVAANAVTADKVAANAITTAKIAAGAVTATEIAAQAITAGKLAVIDTTNLVLDPLFADFTAWNAALESHFVIEDGEEADNAKRVARFNRPDATGTAQAYVGEIYAARSTSFMTPAETGRTVRLSVRVKDSLNARGTLQLQALLIRSNGATSTSGMTSYDLGLKDGYETLVHQYTIAENVVSIAWRVRYQYSRDGEFRGPFKLMEPSMRYMASAELIVDGAITASKISIGDFTNLITNQLDKDESGWTFLRGAQRTAAPSGDAYAAYSLCFPLPVTGGGEPRADWNTRIPCVPGEEFYIGGRIRGSGSQPVVFVLDVRVNWFQASAASITTSVYKVDYRSSVYSSFGSTFTAPANAAFFTVSFVRLNNESQTNQGYVTVPSVRRKSGGELIVDGAITAEKIAALAITADKLAANSVTADKLTTNSVTTAKIAAGAVTANELAAKSVSASKLLITNTDAVNLDPMFEDIEAWTASTVAVKPIVGAPSGPNVWYSKVTTNAGPNLRFGIDPSKTYLFTFVVRKLAASNGREFAFARFFDADGNVINVAATGWPGTNAPNGNHYWPAVGQQTAPSAWTTYTLSVGPEGTAKFPDGTAYCLVGAFFNYGATTPVEVQVNTIRITEMARGELIVDGAITADKVAAKSITASKLVLSDMTNLAPDANLQDPAAWEMYTGWTLNPNLADPAMKSKGALIYSGITGETGTARTNRFIVDAGASYFIERYAESALGGHRIYWITGSGSATYNGLSTAAGVASNTITAPAGAVEAYIWYSGVNGTANKVGGIIVRRMATAELIVNGSIVADKLATNSVTTAKIAAGAVTANEIAAKTITAEKLLISSATNLIPDTADWHVNLSTSASSWRAAGFGVNVNMPAVWLQHKTITTLAPSFEVEVGVKYLFSISITATTGNSKQVIEFVDESGTSFSPREFILNATVVTGGSSNIESFTTTYETDRTKRVRLKFFANDNQTDTTGGYVWFRKPLLRPMAGAEVIVDGAITADKLSANSVVSGKIAANAVAAVNIAANAVTAGKIAANAVTAGTIAAGAVNTDQLAANAVTASKVVLTDRSNMVPDPEFADWAAWPTRGAAFGTLVVDTTDTMIPAGAAAKGTLDLTGTANAYAGDFMSGFIPIEPDTEYYKSIWFRSFLTGTEGTLQFYFTTYDATKTLIGSTRIGSDYILGQSTAVTQRAGILKSPSNAAFIRFRVRAQYSAAGKFTGTYFMYNPVLRKAASAELIVDGAITANKIAANAIAVGTAAIQNGAIVNAHIGNLSADKITAGVLAAARIAAGTITSGHLAANSVTTEKIATGAVTANEIAAATITAAKIASKTITATQLAANSVTATEINVSTLSAIAANLGTVTAGRIQNAANNVFWDLGATGATRALQLGSDLTYDAVNGLTINKLNVIGTANLANNSITQITSRSYGRLAFYVSTERTLATLYFDGVEQQYVWMSWISRIVAQRRWVQEYYFESGAAGVGTAVTYWQPVQREFAFIRIVCYINGVESPYKIRIPVDPTTDLPTISALYALPAGTTGAVFVMEQMSREAASGNRDIDAVQIHTLAIKR